MRKGEMGGKIRKRVGTCQWGGGNMRLENMGSEWKEKTGRRKEYCEGFAIFLPPEGTHVLVRGNGEPMLKYRYIIIIYLYITLFCFFFFFLERLTHEI